LHYEKGIEVGHIFKLGTKYSKALGATCLDRNGKAKPIVMGSYGIGVERLMQVIVEQHHDEAGIIWPTSVAPFDIYLLSIGKGNVLTACDELYATLQAAGLRVLYDERKERAGVKFNDADLIGLPLRLLVSKRLLKEGAVELKARGGEAVKVPQEELLEVVRRMMQEG
jgi:prolyl-tRNA synthetase